MSSLPRIEYNYYEFIPAAPHDTRKKYQILESFFEYKLIVGGETIASQPGAKYSLGWDRTILNLYRLAYVVAGVACTLAALTMIGWVLGVSNLLLLKAIVVVVISSRCIDYLERRMKNKSFEIAAKVIQNYGKSDGLYDRTQYKP